MLAIFSDTHATADPDLTPAMEDALARASTAIHAGDFTTPAVLDSFAAATDRLVAVYGNRDAPGVRDRLPRTATVEALDRTILVVHGHDHDRTSLPLAARQADADAVVVGHSHRPAIERMGGLVVVNPGSHADPRGARPAYATVGQADGAVVGRLRTPEGQAFDRVEL
jgi:hypothetical protein